MMRKGLPPCQWVLGRFPRGAGHLLGKYEWAQLGVVQVMMDSTTEFELRSQYRPESRKKFFEQDCSRSSAALLLRESVPMPKQYREGDLVCFLNSKELPLQMKLGEDHPE